MTNFYEHISIKNYKDGASYKYIEESGQNPIDQKMNSKYFEAEGYRLTFRAIVERRLHSATRSDNDSASDLAFFYEQQQATILKHLVMTDFYYHTPTTLKCSFKKMGGDHRRAKGIIDGAIDARLLLKTPLPADHRQFILFPTIRMISDYERQLAQVLYEIEFRQGKDPTDHYAIKEILHYDKLRKKFLPANLTDQISVTLSDFQQVQTRKGPELQMA